MGLAAPSFAKVDLRALGDTFQALVRIKPRSGPLHVVEKRGEEQPRFLSCDRVTGDDCYVTRLALADVADIKGLFA